MDSQQIFVPSCLSCLGSLPAVAPWAPRAENSPEWLRAEDSGRPVDCSELPRRWSHRNYLRARGRQALADKDKNSWFQQPLEPGGRGGGGGGWGGGGGVWGVWGGS